MAPPEILWRRVLQATIDTLRGKSRGQYDIRLARPEGIEGFFAGLPREAEGDLGGYNVQVPLEAANAPISVPATSITVAYIGPESTRADWRVPSQRPDTAYPLWREGVGLLPTTEPGEDYVVLIRGPDSRYHARWLRSSDLGSLPDALATRMSSGNAGVEQLDPEEWGALKSLLDIPEGGEPESPPEPAEPAEAPPPGTVGEPYRHEDETVSTTQPDPFQVDPDVLDRGISGHRKTQNALASFLADSGAEPRSHRPGAEPPFDLAWDDGTGQLRIAEVKSLTAANEEKQLRLGLGQLLRYAHQMRSRGYEHVTPVLVGEREPRDGSWIDLCDSLGVILVWPGSFDRLLP